MLGFLLVIACGGVLVLLGLGALAEIRRQSVGDLLRILGENVNKLGALLWSARQEHPLPGLALLESVIWLGFLLPLLDDALHPHEGKTAFFVWAMTIIPHEMGHVICSPFGWFMAVAGGSIWQILFWGLLASYALILKRQVGVSMIFWMIVGHSFINLSVYIRDASHRQLDLIFGLDKSHHDWWNLLRTLRLLDYDWLLADVALTLGVLIVLLAILIGIVTAWLLPRQFGKSARFEGGFWLASIFRKKNARANP